MLKFLSLKQKLLMSYALLILFFGGVIVNTVVDLGEVAGLVDDMYKNALEPAVWVSSASAQAIYQNRDLYDNVCESDPKERAKIEVSMKSHGEKMEKMLQDFSATPLSKQEKALLESFRQSWASYQKTSAEALHLSSQGDRTAAMKVLSGPASEEFEVAEKSLNELVSLNEEKAKEEKSSSALIYTKATKIAETASTAVLIVAVVMGILLSSAISRSILKITAMLTDGANSVATATAQIASAGTELSAAASEQAAALQETVASIDEINAMVMKNTENSEKSQEMAASSKESSLRGKETVDEMLHSIQEISDSNNEIMSQIEAGNREISQIVTVINEIGNQTKVINDIVFQTKLLSFNASIEAARAGEHGKGFAVVAEEVGNLAQMSGNAAGEISRKLESSIQKVQQIVDDTQKRVQVLVENGKGKVDAGVETARRCGETLDEIVEYVNHVNSMVGEITIASKEQSIGVAEITKAMGQMDSVTQQNAAAAEETAAASESLTHQASQLRMIVIELAATVQGASSTKAEPIVLSDENFTPTRKAA